MSWRPAEREQHLSYKAFQCRAAAAREVLMQSPPSACPPLPPREACRAAPPVRMDLAEQQHCHPPAPRAPSAHRSGQARASAVREGAGQRKGCSLPRLSPRRLPSCPHGPPLPRAMARCGGLPTPPLASAQLSPHTQHASRARARFEPIRRRGQEAIGHSAVKQPCVPLAPTSQLALPPQLACSGVQATYSWVKRPAHANTEEKEGGQSEGRCEEDREGEA